jgi:hypothetical protein
VDTRAKIVPLRDVQPLLAHGEWLAVVGLFDPLTAAQAKRVAECAMRGRKLLVVVLDETDTLLSAEARTALMASLRDVCLVTVAKPHEWRKRIAVGTRIEIAEDDEAEEARSAEFVDLVLKREAS